jgi:hypothetical protein
MDHPFALVKPWHETDRAQKTRKWFGRFYHSFLYAGLLNSILTETNECFARLRLAIDPKPECPHQVDYSTANVRHQTLKLNQDNFRNVLSKQRE